jgi:hypothetical protein
MSDVNIWHGWCQQNGKQMSTKLTSDGMVSRVNLVTPERHSSKPFGFVELIILENMQSKIKQTFIT